MTVSELWIVLLGMAGFGAFASALVNTLKALGVVKDGQAQVWLTGINLVGVVALYALNTFGIRYDLSYTNEVLSLTAQALVAVGQLLVALGASKAFHSLVRGTPLVGKSFSG